MPKLNPTEEAVLRLSPKIEVLPVLHGSGDMAQEVREALIGRRFDCLAVPLPPSVERAVEDAVQDLPQVRLVVLPESHGYDTTETGPDGEPVVRFIPIDPC